MENQEAIETPAVEDNRQGESLIDWRLIALFTAITLVGLGSGYGLSRLISADNSSAGQEGTVSQTADGQKIKVGQTYGNQSEVFPDETIGVIEENTQEGEGTHKLIREGGESQTAYLTSSLVNLDLFVGRKVKVWGETFAAQKVGWLMDVGAVKVLE